MSKPQHIVLRSDPDRSGTKPLPIYWGEIDPLKRGPVIGSLSKSSHRNAIGTHSGSYSVYRALAVASGALQADHRPDFTNTSPTAHIGPHPSWGDRNLIVSLDPLGVWLAKFTLHFPSRDTISARQLLSLKLTLICRNCKMPSLRGGCKSMAK